MSPRTMSYRQFCLENGVDPNGYCEPALHNPMGFIPKAAHRRHMKMLAHKQADHAEKLALVTAQWHRLVRVGEIKEETGMDRLRRAAAGMDELESTQAARRILARLARASLSEAR